ASCRRRPARSAGPRLRHGEASATSLGAVLRAALLAIGDAGSVQRGPNDLVAVARQVLRRAAANQNDGVLLEVVALAGDVGADLGAVGQPDTGNLAERRVRLPRGLRHHARADAPLLRRAGERRGLHLCLGGDTALADELIDGGQRTSGFIPLHTTTVGWARWPCQPDEPW